MGFGILGTKYRTSVLNDFSVVSKAVFHILEEGDVLNGRYSIKESLPVQINPTEIKGFDGKNHVKNIGGIGGENGRRRAVFREDENDDDEDMSITLHYDIYDEYQVRTMNGLLDTENDLSLCSSTATSLAKLRAYAGNPDLKVYFKWGEIECYGLLASVDFTYTTFSPWGSPLKADATVVIKKEHLGFDNNDEEKKPNSLGELSFAYKSVQVYSKAESVVNRGALGLTQALR